MDVNKLLKTVHNLNDYISATQVVINKYSNSKIQFNMSTVLSLKKIRSLEIEYFNKCDESGAGIKILELMLRLPPSKTWSLLGKELILLMQYWLEAIRKHLILHNNHWWNFLSTVLKFIQDIRSKHTVLSNILVQDLSECLLDLATKPQASVVQRFKLLQCYNSVCAESSRETRYALRNKLGIYFVKLSSILASCGDVRAQYSIMETLLRWLVPRQDMAVKHEAAAKWFPQHLYNVTARTIFIERPWQNFFKNAREFLNAHNMSSDLIATVLCRRFCIGNVTLISDTHKDYYLDLNTSTEIISLMVEPGLSDVLGTPVSDAVIISKENTNAVRMQRESSRVLISINIIDPRLLYPSKVLEHQDILIVVSCRSDLAKLNRALRRIFDSKYELRMDLESPPVTSPPVTSHPATSPPVTSPPVTSHPATIPPVTSPPVTSPPVRTPPGRETPANCNMSEDTRFSNPVELSKRKRSGYMVRLKPPLPWKSPSTASTSSLALLREKLTAFPGYKFDKEPVSVCALPQLSNVSELSEDERQSLNATLGTHKRRTYGVCNKNYKRADRTSQSDEEGNKCITPINVDENSISCLLVATIGSNDSLINDTLERLPKGKEVHTDNIVELLAKEALQSTDTKLHSTNEKTYSEINSDVIEETQHATAFINKKIFFSNSTKDVSSTDKVEDIQFVNDRRGGETITLPLEEKSKIYINENEQTTYSVKTVEDFFSHHCSQNRGGGLLISPTLAKKINETSSESTLEFEVRTPMSFNVNNIETNQYDVHFNYIHPEVVECLNDMVDIVCDNLKNCTEYLSKEIEHLCDKVKEFRSKTPLKEIHGMAKTTKIQQKKKTPLKLQYKNTKTVKRRGKKPNKLGAENIKRMPTIVEKDSDVEKTLLQNNSPKSNTQQLNDYETPLIKRKRKLYSPKDDNAGNEQTGIHISETEDDYSVLTGTRLVDKTPKTLATSYKDIEKIRRTSARDLRIRKSGINLSPRTKKNNDIFDNLKITVEGEGKIILVDKKISSRNKKLAVYNFSSDSEDDDFQKRKGVKRCSSTIGSVESAKSTRARKSKRNVISTETNKEKKKKQDKRRKSKTDLKQQILDPRNEMIDERIREAATEALNTSVEIVQQHDLIPKALEPIILEIPEMEVIEDVKDLPTTRTTRRKRTTNLSLKKENVIHIDKNVSCDKELSVRSSPLPGLIIETVQVQIHKDPDDSITVAMIEKYKDIYNNEPLPDISEINTTHNLLSDLGQITYDSNLNNTEEFNTTNRSNTVSKRLRNEILNISPKAKKSKLSTSSVSEEIESQVITLSEVSYAKSDKSIDTSGKSPITGHGDFDESPPNTEQLNQRFEPTGLETQNLNESMKDYFNKLTKDLYEGSQSSNSEKKMDKTMNSKELEKSPIKLIKETSTANMSPTISITRLSPKEIGRWLPPRFNSLFGSNQSSENDHPVRTTRSQSKLRRNDPNSITTKSSKMNFYKSSISPVKVFGEGNKKKSVTSDHNDYVEQIKNIMTKKRKNLKTINTNFNSSRYDLRKCSNKLEKSGKTGSSKNSTNVEYSNKTRRSSPVFEVAKKEQTRTIISDFESGDGSSINEWFDRNELQKQSRAESTDLSLKDNLENVMEKLETTLTEIHHKTSKKFVSMFVDAQNHLTDLKEKRRQLYRQTALELISDIVKVTDDKFGELERRSQELDGRFVGALRDKARDVTRADRRHKRAMVALLKEDVQTVLNHIKNGGRANL